MTRATTGATMGGAAEGIGGRLLRGARAGAAAVLVSLAVAWLLRRWRRGAEPSDATARGRAPESGGRPVDSGSGRPGPGGLGRPEPAKGRPGPGGLGPLGGDGQPGDGAGRRVRGSSATTPSATYEVPPGRRSAVPVNPVDQPVVPGEPADDRPTRRRPAG